MSDAPTSAGAIGSTAPGSGKATIDRAAFAGALGVPSRHRWLLRSEEGAATSGHHGSRGGTPVRLR